MACSDRIPVDVADASAVGTCSETYGPWSPGLSSQLTPQLWSLCTIFRDENVFTTYAQAVELSDLTGLAPPQLVVFRPHRLALHEVLVRVIADYEIPDPDGSNVASLGINFRRMTRAILSRYVAHRMPEIERAYEPIRSRIHCIVDRELATAFDRSMPKRSQAGGQAKKRWFRGGRDLASPAVDELDWAHNQRLVEGWSSKAQGGDPLAAAAYAALITVVSAVESKHGRLWGDRGTLASLTAGLACNMRAADEIGQLIEPLVVEAAKAEGFRPLPAQVSPIVLSTKGTSASGKSTMRPLQRALATRMGVNWGDFALISPDIFRRDLLDIDSLGEHHKYFGSFTSHETEIVDRKLDRHIARKAQRNSSTHCLYDRFRFDSFIPDSVEYRELFSRLSKVQLIHYLLMITPPHQTVERAWRRGLQLGRYKAVDDLLAHNVEAYGGMQRFFLARALGKDDLNQHYEFVDNDVPIGQIPLTVAFARNREMIVLDVNRILDLDRYQRININARDPRDVYPPVDELSPEKNLSFLATCVKRFPVLRLAHQDTGRIYARVESGRLAWHDSAACAAIPNEETKRALGVVLPELFAESDRLPVEAEYLDRDGYITIGRWGVAREGRRSGTY
jgi:hypothetical protein